MPSPACAPLQTAARRLTLLLVLLLCASACGDGTEAPEAPADTTLAGPAGTADAAVGSTAADSLPAATPAARQPADVVALLRAEPRYSTFVAALDAAGLSGPLRDTGPFTVFAPTDDAFAALPAGTLPELLRPENVDRLRDVLLFHVVQGVYVSATLRDTTLMAQQAGTLRTRVAGGFTVNDAAVVAADRTAGNGVVHAIDAVLVPPAAP